MTPDLRRELYQKLDTMAAACRHFEWGELAGLLDGLSLSLHMGWPEEVVIRNLTRFAADFDRRQGLVAPASQETA